MKSRLQDSKKCEAVAFWFCSSFVIFCRMERFNMGRFSMMKRKNLWIAVAACCGTLAAGTLSMTALAADKTMPALTSWNLDNVRTVNGNEPDGRSWIYPSEAARNADALGVGTGSTGFVIWELDDASGEAPGIQVRTNEDVADWALRNCIMASGTGKVCGDASGSSKRFKLRVTDEAQPVDLVFDVANMAFTYEDGVDPAVITSRIYRVLMKWANFTNLRAQGFKVEVGYKAADGAFTPAAPGDGIAFELRTAVPRAELGEAGGGPDRLVWNPDEFATFSPSMYEDGAFFDNINVAGLFPPQDIDYNNGQYIYSGEALVGNIVGATTQNYFGRWGYMLNEARLPTGIYRDDDGDPATEGSLVAFWNGADWLYGAANGFSVVPDSVLAAWAAAPLSETQVLPGPRYEAAVIDDLAGLNVDVYLKLASTFDAGANPTITLRLTPVAPEAGIAGNETNPVWLATPAPDIFADAGDATSSSGGGCAIGGSGRFDPTLPALAAAGLVFFGLRRFKSGK
jgi:hypothetical protein